MLELAFQMLIPAWTEHPGPKIETAGICVATTKNKVSKMQNAKLCKNVPFVGLFQINFEHQKLRDCAVQHFV